MATPLGADAVMELSTGRDIDGIRQAARDACPRTADLLIIGDDLRSIGQQIDGVLPETTLRVHLAGTGRAGLERVRACPPDVVLLDLRLPDQSGLDVYQQIRAIASRVPVIFVLNTMRADAVIDAMRRGAYDCLSKPLDFPVVRRLIREALDVAARMRQSETAQETIPDLDPGAEIVGFCPAMQEIYKAIGRVAAQDVPVLITGESGTGKELVARAIYQHGPRANKPFLALNCAAIPENLLESELFGHEKGAFTGADRRRIGKFEQCHGGTVFLDEIGDMPPALQAKMLRVLQEQAFERVGGNETIRTDVRLIAATHRDLKGSSREGKFRPDLFYRLGVFTIHLPPLRDRGEDLPLMVRHFVRRFSRELGRDVREVAPEALARLRACCWPGNIRELQSVLKQALLQARGTTLLPADLPALPEEPGGSIPGPSSSDGDITLEALACLCLASNDVDRYEHAHRRLDGVLLPRVLAATGGNQQKAARRLGISRQTLRRRLSELGIHLSRRFETDEGDPS
jgi:two-component system nitrogen regulation response regulator GlnG